MHIFYSGVGKGVIEMDPRLGSPRYRLFSCHGAYFKYACDTAPLVGTIDKEYEIMLDSGAFTAWTKGEEVKLKSLIADYTTVIERIEQAGGNIEQVWMINLDKIPGEKGRTATPKEIEEAVRISDENFEVLNSVFPGRILPVFHQNETDERLAEVCEMQDYICVSPRNDLSERFRFTWSLDVHAKLPPNIRTHGLAATGHAMMTKVPWHSVDSATWIAIAAYGGIFVNERLGIRAISDESPTRHERGHHMDNITEPEQEMLKAQMDEWDLDINDMKTQFEARALWNRLMMSRLYRSVGEVEAPKTVDGGLFPL